MSCLSRQYEKKLNYYIYAVNFLCNDYHFLRDRQFFKLVNILPKAPAEIR